jgi:CheY-like chemotaxis protein/HPt (histidine-containing phosphotransfer) domain-containing protein
VLVVDDTQFGRALAGQLLESLGCDVAFAENGLAAVEAAARQPFDLVFMDAEMPVMNGVAATRLLRSRHGERCPRIVATTAHGEAAEHAVLLEAGAADVLVKPITPGALQAALERGGGPAGFAAEPSQEDTVIDSEALANLGALEGPDAPAFLRQIVATFSTESRASGARIRASFENARWAELAARAHALKGAALTVGATRVANLCAALERAEDHPPLAAAISELEQEIDRALRALNLLAMG